VNGFSEFLGNTTEALAEFDHQLDDLGALVGALLDSDIGPIITLTKEQKK
jgi:hypothetical protein